MNEEGFLSDGNDKIHRAEPVLDPIGDGNPDHLKPINPANGGTRFHPPGRRPLGAGGGNDVNGLSMTIYETISIEGRLCL